MTKMGSRYILEDITANTESKTDDFLEAISLIDFLHKKMRHQIKLTNTETGQEFNWIIK